MSPYTPVIRYDQTDDFGLLPEPRRAAEVADWIADTLQPLLDGLDKTRTSFVGEDFARSGDRTVIVPLLQQPNLSLKPPFVLEFPSILVTLSCLLVVQHYSLCDRNQQRLKN